MQQELPDADGGVFTIEFSPPCCSLCPPGVELDRYVDHPQPEDSKEIHNTIGPVPGSTTTPPRCPIEGCTSSVVYWKEGDVVKVIKTEMTCSKHADKRTPSKINGLLEMFCSSCKATRPRMVQVNGGVVMSWPCACGGRLLLSGMKP
jgi:hypothetical protein